MSRQNKALQKRIIAKEFSLMRAAGKKGPTPKGGSFEMVWVRPLRGIRAKGCVGPLKGAR